MHNELGLSERTSMYIDVYTNTHSSMTMSILTLSSRVASIDIRLCSSQWLWHLTRPCTLDCILHRLSHLLGSRRAVPLKLRLLRHQARRVG